MTEENIIIDEVLEAIWYQREDNSDSIKRVLEAEEVIKFGANRDTLSKMQSDGYIRIQGDSVKFTEKGEGQAEAIIRRHRLAERLLSDILDVREDDTLEEQACSFEHSLSPVVADSICTLLAHPPSCPHGLPIPRGACCKKAEGAIKPLVGPLSDLSVGESAKVVFITPKTYKRLEKLGSMGLVPGCILKIQQKRPAVVITIGQTTLALESEIISEIFVRKSH